MRNGTKENAEVCQLEEEQSAGHARNKYLPLAPPYMMLRSYIQATLRAMNRHRGYAALNIIGLAVGIASALMILLFVSDELAYDAQHPDGLYRVTSDAITSGDVIRMAVTPAIHAPTMSASIPEVEAFCRVHVPGNTLIRWGGESFYSDDILFADSSFFQVFAFPLAQGDPARALAVPFSAVLTPELAERLFGSDDPMGKTIDLGDLRVYTVTGVLTEQPRRTHLDFQALLSFNTTESLDTWYYGARRGFLNTWHLAAVNSYVRLSRNSAPDSVAEAMTALVADILPEGGPKYSFELQPVADIHLKSNFQYDVFARGNATSVYIFLVVAVFMLGIACINYMNLATARSLRRATEVGIRKVLGATRPQLARQFLIESVVTSGFALAVALALAAVMMPLFNSLAGKSFVAGDVVAPKLLALLLPATLLVGLVSGAYPALVLTRFTPSSILKRARNQEGGSAVLRRALVVFQFAATLTLLIGTATVYRQLQFFGTMDLGFDRDHLVSVEVPQDPSRERLEVLKARMEEDPRVLGTAATSGIPVGDPGRHDTRPGGRAEDERWLMTFYGVDFDFIETMNFEIVSGRSFDMDLASDSAGSYILNEAAVARLGWQDDPIGREFAWINPNEGLRPGRVIGVVRDFHYEGFRQPIEPAFFAIAPGWTTMLAIRIAPDNQAATLAHLQQVWESVFPAYPFDYRFLDKGWRDVVEAERQFGRIFAFFALLTLFIACLGLVALASYAAEQRRKEVGIRKVMGASASQIVVLLTRDTVVLVTLAFLFAAPIAFWVMRRWLQEFVYRSEMSAEIFLWAAAIAMVAAFATVSVQAARAALADPVRSLRYE